MRTAYNLLAGQSLERIAALSDGVFAIAMTLLVLDLRVPVSEAIGGDAALLSALGTLAPRAVAYFMSFLTLGIFWLAQQSQLSNFAHGDRNLSWLHIGFLFAVSIMPFSTSLLAEYITFRAAIFVYWLNLLLLGMMLLASIRYAARNNLLREDAQVDLLRTQQRRIVIYQMLYAGAALFCFVNTYISIALIVLMELNSLFAPRIRWLDWF